VQTHTHTVTRSSVLSGPTPTPTPAPLTPATPAAPPAQVLACETDLGITAGLQDRVIQCYEGVVYMDFTDRALMAAEGRGVYHRLPARPRPRAAHAHAVP
jgi:hypothetical protein